MPRITLAVPALSLALILFVAACSDNGGPGLATGSIKLVVNPPTSPLDGDGVQAQVDQIAPRDVPADGQLIFDALNPGDHTLTLLDVDPPCTTTNNPRTITVTAGEQFVTTFNVSCQSGFIAITTHTTGTNLDPNGYAVAVDGANAPFVGVNATATVAVNAGQHEVTLSDVAENCAVEGGDLSKTVTVGGGETVPLTFNFTCS
jgi:hypothetical protein